MTTRGTPTKHPIFAMYSIDELSHKLGLSKRYLCDLEDGTKPVGRRFRVNASGILNRPQAELFSTPQQASPND